MTKNHFQSSTESDTHRSCEFLNVELSNSIKIEQRKPQKLTSSMRITFSGRLQQLHASYLAEACCNFLAFRTNFNSYNFSPSMSEFSHSRQNYMQRIPQHLKNFLKCHNLLTIPTTQKHDFKLVLLLKIFCYKWKL